MKLRLREKLLAGFAAVLVLSGIVGAVGIVELNGAASRTADMYTQNVLGVQYALTVSQQMTASGRDEAKADLLADGSQGQKDMVKQSRDELAAAKQGLEAYKVTLSSNEDAATWADVTAKVNRVIADREALLAAIESGSNDTASQRAAMTTPIADMNRALSDVAQFNAQLSKADKDAAADSAGTARLLLIGINVLAVVVGFGIAWFLARSISRSAKDASAAAGSIARGNVNVSLAATSNDEMGDLARSFGEMTAYLGTIVGVAEAVAAGNLAVHVDVRGEDDALGNALNTMVSNLRSILGGVQENATSLGLASDQLQEASDQMAAATGQIAIAINEVTRSTVALAGLTQDSSTEIEQVAAGSEELAANARANTETASGSRDEALRMGDQIARVAKQSEAVAIAANESRQAAVEGQRAVQQAVSSMESIASAVNRTSKRIDQLGEYGQQIGDIVKVIDEIAAQTNLLALNAAIEAARAGDQGRGFAVVAENVRQLAERSSQSTREIAELIAKVQSGTQEAVEAMAFGVKDVNEGRTITSQAGEALESIIARVEAAAGRMQEIAGDVQALSAGAEIIVAGAEEIARNAEVASTSAGSIADATGRVTEAILQVSATSEQTSASAEEVSASTEELSAQSEELAATAQAMKEMAERLHSAVNRFTLA